MDDAYILHAIVLALVAFVAFLLGGRMGYERCMAEHRDEMDKLHDAVEDMYLTLRKGAQQ